LPETGVGVWTQRHFETERGEHLAELHRGPDVVKHFVVEIHRDRAGGGFQSLEVAVKNAAGVGPLAVHQGLDRQEVVNTPGTYGNFNAIHGGGSSLQGGQLGWPGGVAHVSPVRHHELIIENQIARVRIHMNAPENYRGETRSPQRVHHRTPARVERAATEYGRSGAGSVRVAYEQKGEQEAADGIKQHFQAWAE